MTRSDAKALILTIVVCALLLAGAAPFVVNPVTAGTGKVGGSPAVCTSLR